MRAHRRTGWLVVALYALATAGCDTDADGDGDEHSDETGHDEDGHDEDGHDDHGHDHDDNEESEVFSRVELTFTSPAGGDPIVAAFSDPDGDGGVSGASEPVNLAANTTYTLTIRFENELADPVEDVTEEIKEEAEEHQVFFAGDVIGGLLQHAYADKESDYAENTVGDDLVVGLTSTMTTTAAGSGTLTIQLQHLPDLNGEVVKVPGLEDVYPDVPGWPDLVVDFDVTVQ